MSSAGYSYLSDVAVGHSSCAAISTDDHIRSRINSAGREPDRVRVICLSVDLSYAETGITTCRTKTSQGIKRFSEQIPYAYPVKQNDTECKTDRVVMTENVNKAVLRAVNDFPGSIE